MNEDLAFWLSASIVLFLIGIYGLMSQKDGIRIVISIEIMVMAVNSVFIGIGHLLNTDYDPLAQTYTILSLGVGGAIIGIALVLLTASFQTKETIDVSEKILLRW
ncbi:MAG: NADH-quinone oxidoreductase subunit NuoK [Candidatus Kariarchaeaceae archaeon]|jgi:NAD(P)H-quinone oxidoreductase subunit 4L